MLAEQLHARCSPPTSAKDLQSRVRGLGRPRRRARLDRLPELLPTTTSAARLPRLKQAGRGGIGTVLPRQEDQGPGGQVLGRRAELQQRRRIPATVQRIGLKLHREIIEQRRQAVQDAQAGHRPPHGGHERLRPPAHQEPQVRPGPPRGHEARLLGLGEAVHPERARRLLVRLHHGLRPRAWTTSSCETGPYKGTRSASTAPSTRPPPACGSNLGHLRSRTAILEINFYCDTYGIDTISFGTMTGFLMECWEHGILNKERTGGMDLTWGNWKRRLRDAAPDGATAKRFGVLAGKGVKYLAGILRQGVRRRPPVHEGHRPARQGPGAVASTCPRSPWPSRAATT
ncbi:MAG: aldehyde ferredoxin oxidoreductase C-terminal domain-containing protein [Marinilabiliales bacterium]|nr:aldehyde ferredoxin oxidoreductase C-terminal domain-containing protein [Marinilabiliales bacterium]